jgi:hypothetical protein
MAIQQAQAGELGADHDGLEMHAIFTTHLNFGTRQSRFQQGLDLLLIHLTS